MKRRILLVDFYNLFIRGFQACPSTNQDGEHVGALVGTIRGLRGIIDKIKPTDVYIVSDGENSALRRKMKLKDYKGGRRKEWTRGACRAFDFLNEADQKTNWKWQKARVWDYINTLPVKTIEVPYVEADDIIAQIVNKYGDRDHQMVIFSTDGDYHQLITKNVVCYNPITKKLWTEKTFKEKHGIMPYNHIYIKVIDGDKSDNVIGVKGVGPKTVLKLFPQLKDTPMESMDELFVHSQHAVDSVAKKLTPSVLGHYKSIIEGEERLRVNYDIMQLSEADIPLQTCDVIDQLWEDEPNEFKRLQLQRMIHSDGLHSLGHQFSNISRAFSRLVLLKRKVTND